VDPEVRASGRLAEAFSYAERLHRNQIRKKTLAPTLSHLMTVASLVQENGGDESEAIAALLHDGPEDCAGVETLHEIRRLFGDRVAHIVEGCTDSLETPPPPWLERKKSYIAHLPSANDSILLVSLADKVHNVRSLVAAHRSAGATFWKRLSVTREQTLWYYESLLRVFMETRSARCVGLTQELAHALDELRRLLGESQIPA